MDDYESEACLKCAENPDTFYDCLEDCVSLSPKDTIVVFFNILIGGFVVSTLIKLKIDEEYWIINI